MTRREILLSRTAARQLERLPRAQAERIRKALRLLSEDPFRPRPGADIKQLWGDEEPALYCLRIGDYRALYFVVGDQVRATEVLHRPHAYRGVD